MGHSCSPPLRSQNAQKGPPTYLPSGVLLVNKVDQLIGQRREMQIAPGTGQHQQAAEGGQELPHFGNWIGDSLEKKGHKTSSVCFFLRFKCLTHTRRHLRMCYSGGLVPSSPCRLLPHAPGLPLPEPGCQQSASGAPAPVGSHALSQSPSPCPQHTGLHDGLNVCPPPTNSSSNPTPGGDGVRRWGLWGNDEVMRVEPL